MKKNFAGPAWFLLFLGLFYTVGAIFSFRRQIHLVQLFGHEKVPPLLILRYFSTPAMFLIEAIVYWRMRRYNDSPRASWGHCFLMWTAYWLPVFLMIPRIMHNQLAASLDMDRTTTRLFFWVILLTAHIFFVLVIRRFWSNKRAGKITTPNSENLLDDVVL